MGREELRGASISILITKAEGRFKASIIEQFKWGGFSAGPEKEKKQYRTWLGLKPKENWDPAHFRARDTNKRLLIINGL